MTTSPVERAADAFAVELARWRMERGLTKKQLAAQMGFDPSYVSHVEGRRHRPTEDFARRAEAVLHAGGSIWRCFQQYDEMRHSRTTAGVTSRDPPVLEQWLPPGTGLVVEQEVATLSYQEGAYRYIIRRALYNAGTEPVTRYLVRIVVDRYPNEPGRSNQHHHDHPLTWEELDLKALCGDPPAQERMEWRAKQDRDADKEVWLLFENEQGRFPLYPGQRTTIEYACTIGEDKWGLWFQRAIRLPTRRLSIRLDLPSALEPQVWGVETSLSAEEAPLRTPVVRHDDGDRAQFEWTTDGPLLNARYRLEWRFRLHPPASNATATAPSNATATAPSNATAASNAIVTAASNEADKSAAWPVPPVETAEVRPQSSPPAARSAEQMHAIGILQRGADRLRQPARHFDLPRAEQAARDIVNRLLATLLQVEELHFFSKGVGLAAPQLGLPWAAAVVRPPERGAEPLILLNPRVVGESSDQDEQYEGCLSFFDARGLVHRPLSLDVEHARWDGSRVVTSFDRAMARLIAHEIDHLEGRLYVDRMRPGVALVPVDEYYETGRPWSY
jgi:peptide deformylase